MSYYPILKAPGCYGWVTLCNFPPNNWEIRGGVERVIGLSWATVAGWVSHNLGVLAPNASRTVTQREVADLLPPHALGLLSLSSSELPPVSDSLPRPEVGRSSVPAWRGSLGLSSATASTSYQGEIDPFPQQGTLLTFCPFLQYGDGIENYLLLLNIEEQAAMRNAEVEVYDAARGVLRRKFAVRNNAANVISLDSLGISSSDLPVVICRGMAGIPLYFSRTADGAYLSLEHTHPPASLVIHGKRWQAQKFLKERWFKRVSA